MRDIAYVNPHDSSDVKVAWDLSRLHWLMPAGQAYLLDGDERHAEEVRAILEDWIAANPCAQTVNWSCTMEAALRLLSWTWFFHVFHASRAWADPGFRERFLCALYLHGDFTERHLEYSDVNGNHCTADAAGLVFAGLFFSPARNARRWLDSGWSLLVEELPRQVYADGVDFEASVAYHRLVAELFLLPALYRQACGLEARRVPGRLAAMAGFTAAYIRPDGGTSGATRTTPAPLGAGADRPPLLARGCGSGVQCLSCATPRPAAEQAYWLLGPAAAAAPARRTPRGFLARVPSAGRRPVMRNQADHTVDCGPVASPTAAGRHNDACRSRPCSTGATW
jgi:hypothetical protein